MGIDWTTEPYARLFKKDTDDDLVLSWEARAIWHEFLKRCDQVGVIETKRGARGLAAHVRIPVEVVERALPELLEDGRVVAREGRFVAPNYLDANFSARADKARAADSRLRRRHFALGTESGSHGASGSVNDVGSHGASDTEDQMDSPHGAGVASHDVTNGHSASQPVTQIRSDQIRSDHRSARERARGGFSTMSEDWQPREREVVMATTLGLDVDEEAVEFRDHWIGDGRKKRDWDSAFSARLQSVAKQRRRNAPSGASEIRKLPDL